MKKFIFFILFVIGYTTAQIISSGSCPIVHAKPDFILNQFMGDWYEIEKYPTNYQLGLKCIKSKFSQLTNDSFSTVSTGLSTITNKDMEAVGHVNIIHDGHFAVRFPPHESKHNYLVLDTDYDTYSVGYSCTNTTYFGMTKRNEYVWVLARSKYPTIEVVAKARRVLVRNNIAPDYLIKTSQLRCHD